MANKKIIVEAFCPGCEEITYHEVDREVLKDRDYKGVGRVDFHTYLYKGIRSNPHYVNGSCCNLTLVVKGVKNITGEPKGIEFCSECGKFIDPKIANGDNLCPECGG